VIEEERKHGVTEGTRLAVAHTGGIISSCGLIMAGTFGAMLTGSLTALRGLGVALGLGGLLDTFLRRAILAPAFVILADRSRPARPRPSPLMEGHAAGVNGDGALPGAEAPPVRTLVSSHLAQYTHYGEAHPRRR